MTFGQWIVAQRGERSATSCAERAGMTPAEWSRWENDTSRRADGKPSQPTIDTILKIARGLECNPTTVRNAAYPLEEVGADCEYDIRLAKRLRTHLAKIQDAGRRQLAEDALIQNARSYAALSA